MTSDEKYCLAAAGRGVCVNDLMHRKRIHTDRLCEKLRLPPGSNWIRMAQRAGVPLIPPHFATAHIVLPPRLVNALRYLYWYGATEKAASWLEIPLDEMKRRLRECREALNCVTNEQCILVAIGREWFDSSRSPKRRREPEPEGEIVRLFLAKG